MYLYTYIYIYIEKRTEHSAFFAKEQKVLVLFYVLCKRKELSLRSFPFFWKERKRTERSFGSHKSPKTQKKNEKERNVL